MYNDMPDWQAAEKAEEEIERLGKVIAELKAELRDMVGYEDEHGMDNWGGSK
mgnify:CR=1 FL=1